MPVDQLVAGAVNQNQSAQRRSSQAQRAEEMHGPGEVFQQEADGENIEQHAKRSAQPVMGFTSRAWSVADGNLRHAGAVEARERRNEAVQFAVQVDVFQNFGAVRLKRGAEIAQIKSGSSSHEPVGDA